MHRTFEISMGLFGVSASGLPEWLLWRFPERVLEYLVASVLSSNFF
jgi:hypothetical protein